MDNLKTEGDVEEDLVHKLQLQSLTEEEKIAEMQNLLSVQRKTINSLNKMNNELTQAVTFFYIGDLKAKIFQ